MVFQAGVRVPVWGTAAPGEKIAVRFAGQTRIAAATPSGEWRVTLDPLTVFTEPQTLVVRGEASSGELRVGDILVGEVWLCSGQSNMRYALGCHCDPENGKSPLLFPVSLANCTNPRIRLLNVSGGTSADRKWDACQPENAAAFSAVG